ncbi:hypothetical protein Tco_0313853 [Tanacetum coccineum]
METGGRTDNGDLHVHEHDDNVELDEQGRTDNGDLHVHEHDDNVELDEVIRESKKRKRGANLATWTDNGDLHVHEHDYNVELDEVIRESKKKKRGANLATWKYNDVIEVESSDDETIFNGNDYIPNDTLDDLLSISSNTRKETDQVFVFSRNNI